VNPSYGLSLQYPLSWDAIESKTNASENPYGSLAVLLAPLENPTDAYQERILISLQNLGSNVSTLEDYTNQSISEYRKLGNNTIQILESSPTNLSGNPAHKIVFTEAVNGQTLKKMQVWSIVDNKVYLAIFSAQESQYGNYIPSIQKTFDSLRVNPDAAAKTIDAKTRTGNLTTTNATNATTKPDLDYENTDFNVSIKYPSSWIKAQHGIPLFNGNNSTFFFVEFVSLPNVVNLGVQNITSKNVTLPEYSGSIIDFISKNGGQMLETSDMRIGQSNAHKIVYTLGDSSKIMYLWTIKGDKAYHFIFKSNVAEYDQGLSIVNPMLASLRIG
jgi:hypothetical protein